MPNLTVEFCRIQIKRPNLNSNSNFEFDIVGRIPNFFESNSKFVRAYLYVSHNIQLSLHLSIPLPPPSLFRHHSFSHKHFFWSSQLRKIVKNLFQNKCSLKLSKKGVHLSFFLSPSPSHTHTFTRVLSLHWEVLSNNKRKLCRNKTLQQQQHQQQQHQQHQHKQQQQQQRQQPKHARIQKRWIKV